MSFSYVNMNGRHGSLTQDRITVHFSLSHDFAFDLAFSDAHSRADSTLPLEEDIGVERYLNARALRMAENNLRRKLGKDLLPL